MVAVGVMLKLAAGIGVGMGTRVVGTVRDGYKYLSPCSSLTYTKKFKEILQFIAMFCNFQLLAINVKTSVYLMGSLYCLVNLSMRCLSHRLCLATMCKHDVINKTRTT